MRLARVGIENVAGYLADGVAGWVKSGFELDYIPQITVQDFVELRNSEPDRIAVLDVRELGEVEPAERSRDRVCIPLGKLRFAAGGTGSRETSGRALQRRLSQFHRHQHSAACRLPRHREPDRRVRRLENVEPLSAEGPSNANTAFQPRTTRRTTATPFQ